jgi:ABC-type multidrug transport system permease subunit
VAGVAESGVPLLRREPAARRLRALPAAAAGIFRRDAAIRLSYRGALISENVGVIFSLAVFHFIAQLVHVPPFVTPKDYFAYTVVGIIALGIIHASLTVPPYLRQELVAGTYERLELSTFGGTGAVASLILFPIVYAITVATVQLAVAVAIFGLRLDWTTAPLALPIAALGALSFAPLAFLFSATVLAFKQSPGQGFVLAGISLVAGTYFPVALLPWWLEWLSYVQPLTPTLELLRHVLLGFPMRDAPWLAVVKICGFIVVGVPVGLYAIARAAAYGRRRGTLIEY